MHDPLSAILDNMRDYQFQLANSYEHSKESSKLILDQFTSLVVNLNQDDRAKFVQLYLMSILDNKKIHERAIVFAMLISISKDKNEIFNDDPTLQNSISLMNTSGFQYSIFRSRLDDDDVRMYVLSATMLYLKDDVAWLNDAFDASTEVGVAPLRNVDSAKVFIRKIKAMVASAKSRSKSRSDVQYIFENVPPTESRGRSSRAGPQHNVAELNQSLKDSLIPPNSAESLHSSSRNVSSSTSQPAPDPTFSFKIKKVTGKDTNWTVTLTIPASSPQACFYRLMLHTTYTLKGFAVQDTRINCVNALAGFAFSVSNEKFLNRELEKQQKKSKSDSEFTINDLRSQAGRVVSDGFKAVYFAWYREGKSARQRNLVAGELQGLEKLFQHLLQKSSKFSDLLVEYLTSSTLKSISKRVVANLKAMNSNKQPCNNMLFQTMSASSNSSMAIPYAGVDASSKFTAFIDTHTLSFRLLDGRTVPVTLEGLNHAGFMVRGDVEDEVLEGVFRVVWGYDERFYTGESEEMSEGESDEVKEIEVQEEEEGVEYEWGSLSLSIIKVW